MVSDSQKLMPGKVVVVTGAGRGIGRAIALLMAEHGANVVVNDIGTATDGQGTDSTPAEDVVRDIRANGTQAIVSYDSVSDWNGAKRIIEAAVDTFGRLDAVVNNAGILRDAIFHKMAEESWDAVIAVHLKGSFNVSRAAAGYFRDQGGGAFVHMTSGTGLIGNIGQANYAAAKLGIVGLSKSIALDMARFNVRSNCISPFAWSRMVGSIPTDTPQQAARVERIKQMGPEKIAPLAVALCSDNCDTTGQIFVVRNNEIFLMSQPRPLRSAHAGDGWTANAVMERVLPGFKGSMYPLDTSADVFCWDPM